MALTEDDPKAMPEINSLKVIVEQLRIQVRTLEQRVKKLETKGAK